MTVFPCPPFPHHWQLPNLCFYIFKKQTSPPPPPPPSSLDPSQTPLLQFPPPPHGPSLALLNLWLCTFSKTKPFLWPVPTTLPQYQTSFDSHHPHSAIHSQVFHHVHILCFYVYSSKVQRTGQGQNASKGWAGFMDPLSKKESTKSKQLLVCSHNNARCKS